MEAKALEVRDRMTFIPVLAVDMNPDGDGYAGQAQRYLLRRCGYSCVGLPNILLTKLTADGSPATNDPYWWSNSRTFTVAHNWIIDHWSEIKDGDVIDVEFILGETAEKKLSERETVK